MSAPVNDEVLWGRVELVSSYLETLVSYAQWETEHIEEACADPVRSARSVRASAERISNLLALAMDRIGEARELVATYNAATNLPPAVVAERRVAR
ncbi:hypothetical protein BH10PSE13_BH10PSE13_00160 [soil metagenome]